MTPTPTAADAVMPPDMDSAPPPKRIVHPSEISDAELLAALGYGADGLPVTAEIRAFIAEIKASRFTDAELELLANLVFLWIAFIPSTVENLERICGGGTHGPEKSCRPLTDPALTRWRERLPDAISLLHRHGRAAPITSMEGRPVWHAVMDGIPTTGPHHPAVCPFTYLAETAR